MSSTGSGGLVDAEINKKHRSKWSFKMKRSINYVISLILAISLIGGVFPFALSDQYEAYAAADGEKFDSFLSGSPDKYNNDLALTAAEFSLATYTGKIDKMLYDLGCKKSKVKSENYGGAKAYTVAEKSYKSSESTRVLIIAVRGTTVKEERIKDFTAKASAPVGKYYAYDYMNDFCDEIIDKVDKVVDKSKHYKVLITGHSLGGATANLVAVKMMDKKYTKRSDIFCYTFAAINSINTKKPVRKGYENIHNIYNDNDTFAPDRLGQILITNAGSKYGKFGHMDCYFYSHIGIDHDMENYIDDIKKGIVKWSVLRECSKYHNPPETPQQLYVTGGDKSITIRWKKLNQKILDGSKVGYQIRYSTNDKFKSAKEKTISGYGTTSKSVKGLQSSKAYYVKIRSFITFKGVTVYSPWSTFKKAVTKKGGGGRKTEKKIADATIKSCSKAKTFSGKKLKQQPMIAYGGTILKEDKDYTVSYENNYNVGLATVRINGAGLYTGTVVKHFKIVPKGTSLLKTSVKTTSAKVSWKTMSAKMSKARINGYRIEIATNSKFTKGRKQATVKGYKTSTGTFKGLKSGTKYYVRVRTYMKVGKKTYYSGWSKTGNFTTKKKAVSGYTEITSSPVKVGSYYYKQSDWDILKSSSKSSGYKAILKSEEYFYRYVYTNGTYLYTVEETNTTADDEAYYLVRYSAAGKDRKVVKNLPHDPGDSLGFWWIAAANGQKLILTHGEDFRLYTYCYDIQTGKLTKVLTDRAICNIYLDKCKSGSYAICNHYMDTSGLVASPKSLYKITSDGKMLLIKDLGDNVDAAFVGNKLYYVKFVYDFKEESGNVDVYVYSCNIDGSNNTLIHSYTDYYENGCVLRAEDFTTNTCNIIIDGVIAHVNYEEGSVEWEYPE